MHETETRQHSPETAADPGQPELAETLAFYEDEARARGGDAALFHEIGRLWEEHGKNPRNAAVAYQNAYRADRTHLPTLQAARRLFAEVGNWQMVSQLLEAEAEASDDPARRARLLFERGIVLEQRLGATEVARSLWDEALRLDPGQQAVLVHLESLHADGRDPAALAEVLIRTADAVSDPTLKARKLEQAACILEDRAGRPDEARELLLRAVELDPSSKLARARLQLRLEQDGASQELLSLLRRQVRDEGDGAPWLLYRIARVCLRLDREEEAEEALREARRLAPDDALILAELARLYETRQAWEELAELLRARALAAVDENERVALHLALGALYEDALEQPDRALACYRTVVALAPEHGPALAALGRLQYQQGDFQGLLATFEAEAAAADDPRQRAAKLFKAAQLLEERLDQTEEAIRRYDQILAILPGYLPALDALTRLYEKEERWAELVALLEQDLALGGEKDQQLVSLARIAELQETRLRDPAAALATYERMLELAPDHLPAVRSYARVAEAAADWERVLRAHELEAARTGDQRQVLSLLQRCGEILEEKLGDKERAIAAYEQVLTVAPAHLPALRALGRLYAQRGRWEELVEMHRQEAEVTTDRQTAAELVFKVGELYEDKLCDEKRAIAAYREVLELSPGHFPALRQLDRIHRRRADWEAVIDVLREEAAARADPGERAVVHCQIAEIREERLADRDGARSSWEEALRLQPDNPIALAALERLCALTGSFRELAASYERALEGAEDEDRAGLLVKLAQLCLDRLGEPTQAARWAEEAVQLDGSDLAALALLERIRGAQGDRQRRADVRGQIARASGDPAWSCALLLAAAADRDRKATGTAGLQELRDAVKADPGDERAREILERALRRVGDGPGLAAILTERVKTQTNRELELVLLQRLAELRELRLGDPEGALQAYRQALAIDGSHLPVLRALCRLHAARGEWAELRQALLSMAAALKSRPRAVEALLEASRIAEEKLADADAAADDCRALLARYPGELAGIHRLEELLASRGGAGELADLYERRGRAEGEPMERADAFVRAARLRHRELREPQRALALLQEAREVFAGHEDALELEAEVAVSLQQREVALAALSARVQLGGAPAHLAELHLRIARLHLQADSTLQAIAHLQAALVARPDHPEALRLLADQHLRRENHAGASAALERLLTTPLDLDARLLALQQLSQVREEGASDLAGAAQLLEERCELRADPDSIERLANLYERMRDLPRLASTLDRLARMLEPEDGKRAAAAWARAGEVLAIPLRAPQKGAEAFRRALSLDPSQREARASLADVYAALPDTRRLAVEQHRQLLEEDPLRVASWRSLLRLWQEMGERDRAFVAGSVLEFLQVAASEELLWVDEQRASRPPAGRSRLSLDERRTLLLHPAARGPLLEVCREIGDELPKLVPPSLSRYRVARADRLGPAHPLAVALHRHLAQLGEEEMPEIYGSDVPLASAVETTAPCSIVVGLDLAALPAAERGHLLGRLAFLASCRLAFVTKLSRSEAKALLAAAVYLHDPDFPHLGAVDADLVKKLSRALSRKTRKQLAEPVGAVAEQRPPPDGDAFLDGCLASAERAGLVFGGDIGASLSILARQSRPDLQLDDVEGVRAALGASPLALGLLRFAASDAHFRLRGRVGHQLPA